MVVFRLYGVGIDLVWFWYRVVFWYGEGIVLVCCSYCVGMVLVWFWYGVIMMLVWW